MFWKIHNLNLRKILLINNGLRSFLWFLQSFCQPHLLVLLVRICFERFIICIKKDYTHKQCVAIFFVVLAIILTAALAYITGKKTPFKDSLLEFRKILLINNVLQSFSWFLQSFWQRHLLILLVRKHLLKIHNLNLRKILLINNGLQSFCGSCNNFVSYISLYYQ